jgi:hypothetical protein
LSLPGASLGLVLCAKAVLDFGNSCSASSPRDNIELIPSRRSGSLHLDPLERPLHRLIRDAGAAPALQPSVHQRNHQETEHAGEYPIGEEMRAGRHAQDSAEGERGAVSERAPLRRHDRGSRHCPERAGWFAGDERAIFRAIAARVPPGTEMLVPAKFAEKVNISGLSGVRIAPNSAEMVAGARYHLYRTQGRLRRAGS